MRTILSGLFVSLDGVVSAHSDWQFAYFDAELFAGIAAAWERSDVAVMGRRSYEGYRQLRDEHPDSPMLAFLDSAQRYVLSRTLRDPGWPGTTVLAEQPYERLAKLKRQPGSDILVAGSPSVVRGLLAAELLDELTVTVLPIVVGSGDRLFPESADGEFARLGLRLAESSTLASGAVQLHYQPA